MLPVSIIQIPHVIPSIPAFQSDRETASDLLKPIRISGCWKLLSPIRWRFVGINRLGEPAKNLLRRPVYSYLCTVVRVALQEASTFDSLLPN